MAARPVDGPPIDLRRAALFMVASAFSFAVMGAAVKVAARDVPTTMSVFFRNAFGLAVLLPWAWSVGLPGLRTTQFTGHLVRALAGLAAMACFFTALGRARLADATVVYQAFPLFLPIIERLWLGHRVVPRVVVALLVGFAGVVSVLRPGTGMFSSVLAIGTGAALFAAIAQVGIRRLTITDPVTRIVFYFGVIATLVSAVPLPWTWVSPTPSAWVALIVTGVSATFGQLALTRAYSHAPAAMVGPFIYVGVLFAALIDWAVWQTPPDRWFALGAALIVWAGVALLRHQQHLDATT